MRLGKPSFIDLAKSQSSREICSDQWSEDRKTSKITGYLGDANTVDPLLEGSDVIAAKVLDILRLLLDLRMLHTLQS